jgi:hypothetical protein
MQGAVNKKVVISTRITAMKKTAKYAHLPHSLPGLIRQQFACLNEMIVIEETDNL